MEELRAGGVIVKGKTVPVEIPTGVEEGRGFLLTPLVDGGRVHWVGDNGRSVGVGDAFGVERASKTAVGRVEARHGKPTKRFAVSTRFRSGRALVIDNKVPHVTMPTCDTLVSLTLCEQTIRTKYLNRSVRMGLPNGRVDSLQGTGLASRTC